jgi:CspA family cold shock protein
MLYGIVKNISPDRGFGFIDQGNGRDVYFHAVDIGDDVFQRLRPDQPVKFELAKRDRDAEPAQSKGPRASRLEVIDRIPGGKLVGSPQELAPRHHPRARQRKATWKRRIDVSSPEKEGQG